VGGCGSVDPVREGGRFLGLIDTQSPMQQRVQSSNSVSQNLLRWELNKGLIGRLRMAVILLLRFRAFFALHVLSWAVMALPWRIASEFHFTLVTQLQRMATRA
jgi:hypothetical protein